MKLTDDLAEASGKCAEALSISRAEYIRRAIEQMNRQTGAGIRARRIQHASRKVRRESMRVNEEFAAIEKDPGA